MSDAAEAVSTRVDDAYQAVESWCRARGLSVARLENASDGRLGIQLHGTTRSWEIYVDCTEEKLRLPGVAISRPFGLLAHVSYGGSVCVNDQQGLSIDPDRHSDIVAYTALAAYDLLERSDADGRSGLSEFYNELEGYWLGLPGSRRGRAAFEVDRNDRLVTAHVDSQTTRPKWYATELNQPVPKNFFAGKTSTRRSLYIHLDSVPSPPSDPDKLNPEYIEAIRKKLSAAQLVLWDSLMGPSMNGQKRLALFVSTPRASGGLSLIGLAFSAFRREIDSSVEVTPLTMRRQTATYMRERGGALTDTLGKHIAVLGCGAVGSVVADSLAAAGVGTLTLVDHDDYSEDNVFRHVLDPLWIETNKAMALKLQLERRYPGLTVNPRGTTAQEWLKSADLSKLDGVVVAFGAPSVERSFSRHFLGAKMALPIAFTWLEPLDLGGHSVAMWSNAAGCLDCIYRDEEGEASLHPRTAFIEPDQHVSRNLTGCSSVFVPYGALQARKTGLMAAEHLLNALSGPPSASYRFWVGEGKAAAAAGLTTTPWWKAATRTLADEATPRLFGKPCKRCRGET